MTGNKWYKNNNSSSHDLCFLTTPCREPNTNSVNNGKKCFPPSTKNVGTFWVEMDINGVHATHKAYFFLLTWNK